MSKQVSNNPRRFLAALKIKPTEYGKLLNIGRRLSANLLAQIAVFATPNPTLVAFDAALDLLQASITLNGNKYNRPSKLNNTACRADAQAVRGMMLLLLEYVYNTVGATGDTNLFQLETYLSAGLSTRNIRSTTAKKLSPVRDLHVKQVQSPMSDVTITWRKPLGLIKGKSVPFYAIEKFTGGIWVGLNGTTRTEYAIASAAALDPIRIQLRVTPIDSNGLGVPTIIYVPTGVPAP